MVTRQRLLPRTRPPTRPHPQLPHSPTHRLLTNTKVAALAVGSAALLLWPARLAAHEVDAPFSGAIIDPPILHHAHIENEQRLNFFVMRGVRDGAGRKRTGYEAELELAFGSKDFRYGFEVFAPLSSLPDPDGDGRATGIGDIEVRPIKYALVMKPDFVLSTATAVGLPTGSESRGLGSGNTSLNQLLFVDKAVGNWAAGLNLGFGGNVAGDKESWFEYGVGVSYSFIRGVKFGEIAPPRPEQKWVLAPSVEFIGERILQGREAGEHSTSLIPGLTLWHTRSGWQLRAGMSFPTSGPREADRMFLIQIGNHLNWGALFGKKH